MEEITDYLRSNRKVLPDRLRGATPHQREDFKVMASIYLLPATGNFRDRLCTMEALREARGQQDKKKRKKYQAISALCCQEQAKGVPSNVPVPVVSDDTSDPVALQRLEEVLLEAHDSQPGVHPSTGAMEQYLRSRYYLRRARELLEWHRSMCNGCNEKVSIFCLLALMIPQYTPVRMSREPMQNIIASSILQHMQYDIFFVKVTIAGA
jgi:hypothetical protein